MKNVNLNRYMRKKEISVLNGRKEKYPKFYFKEKNARRKFMENLYQTLNLNSYQDWLTVPLNTFFEHGGQSFITKYYSNNVKKLLFDLYPEYEWNFGDNRIDSKVEYFRTMNNRQILMEKLFFQFKLNSFEDWKKITKNKIIKNGGKILLKHYYHGNIEKLFLSIFPNYPWEFQDKIILNENYFNDIENQKNFIHSLFYSLKLKNLSEFNLLNKKKIIENGGKYLIDQIYSNDLQQLLTTLFPNYPWKFDHLKFQNTKIKLINFRTLENRQKFIDEIFVKFQMKSLEDWRKITKKDLIKNGGERLIVYYYSNKLQNLLLSIYPNYPWNFHSPDKFNSYSYFKSIENQRKFMENLFIKLKLNSLDDWKSISKSKIIEHGGKSLILHYNGDLPRLFNSVYPSHVWIFDDISSKSKLEFFKDKKNQKEFMNNLFNDLKLKTLDDWLNVSKKKILQKGGNFLYFLYSNQFQDLLTSIYPHYPWQFNLLLSINSNEYFKSIENQREFMDHLFIKFKLKSLDDWMHISRHQIIEKGGKSLVKYFYSNDLKKLLSNVYPHHHWQFDNMKIHSMINYFKSIENQRKFMDKLFIKFKLKSLDDWLFISRNKIILNGGKSLMLTYYSNNMKKLLQTIYPNHNWQFNQIMKIDSSDFFSSIENQKLFLDILFKKLNLKSKDDWLFITKKTIRDHGGNRLLVSYYDNNMQKMLKSIYPDHDWNFSIADLSLIDNQRKLMQKIFKDLNLEKNDDWLKVSRYQLLLHGGRKLLQIYGNDWKLILKEIYPKHDWNFSSLKFRPNATYFKSSLSFNIEKLKQLKKIYSIEEKKDWYRLPSHFEEIDVFHSLSLVYPNEKWHWDIFNTRSKKSNQRLLFSFLHQIYSSSLLIENYRHPHILHQHFSMEFDVFIPSLSLAFEYQGEHHFNDFPSTNFLEVYRARDIAKLENSRVKGINLVAIPYWWDLSLSSLFFSIPREFVSQL